MQVLRLNHAIFQVAALVFATISSGCSRNDATTTSNGASDSLIGRWSRSAAHAESTSPYWITVDFRPNGKFDLYYLPGNMYSTGYYTPPPRNEDMKFTELGNGKVRIYSDTDAGTYTYEIQGNQLFLTTPSELGVSDTLVFTKKT